MQVTDRIADKVDQVVAQAQAAGGRALPVVDALATEGARYGLRVVGVVILIVVAWILGKAVRRWMYRALHGPRLDETFVRFAANTSRGLVLTFAVIASLSVFGLETTSFAAVLGATGVAIGLALQGSLANIASGLLVLFVRPFIVGDTVKLNGAGGVVGTVDEIDLFVTKLDTGDNRRILVPNSQIFAGPIENLTHHPRRRAEVTVTVSARADIGRVREALAEAASGVPGVLEPPDAPSPPSAAVGEFTALGLTWTVGAWAATGQVGQVREGIMNAVQGVIEREDLAPAASVPPVQARVPRM